MSLRRKNTDVFWAEVFTKNIYTSVMKQICLCLQLKYMVVSLQWDVSGCFCSHVVTNMPTLKEHWLGHRRCGLVLSSVLNFLV